MTDGLDRLKVLINSSTPIIVMETSEETHAVSMVRTACSDLNMATFEWTIADGLLRSGTNAPPEGQKMSLQARIDQNTLWTQAGRSYAQGAHRPQPRRRGSGPSGSRDGVSLGRRRYCRRERHGHLQHARTGAGAGQHGVDDFGSTSTPTS